eukprot:Amastigsp_a508398_29.p6 type:complete len:106 gc:universal Amastigsp_a508398_29:1910-1593(-)
MRFLHPRSRRERLCMRRLQTRLRSTRSFPISRKGSSRQRRSMAALKLRAVAGTRLLCSKSVCRLQAKPRSPLLRTCAPSHARSRQRPGCFCWRLWTAVWVRHSGA